MCENVTLEVACSGILDAAVSGSRFQGHLYEPHSCHVLSENQTMQMFC